MTIACGVSALGEAVRWVLPTEIDEGWTLCCVSAGIRVTLTLSCRRLALRPSAFHGVVASQARLCASWSIADATERRRIATACKYYRR